MSLSSPPAPREKRESSRGKQQHGKILLLPSPHQGFGSLRHPRAVHEESRVLERRQSRH